MPGEVAGVAIITGGGSGIGAAAALQLVGLGWGVVLAGRRAAVLAAQAELAEQAGGQALTVTADVSQPDFAPRLVGQATERFGRLDAVINNAGVMHIEPFGGITARALDEALAVNLRAPFLLTQAARSALRAAPAGSVVNVGSAAAALYRPGQSAYGSSKAALEYLTKSLAVELAPDGIRVNAVVPGPVDTEIHDRPGGDPVAVRAALAGSVPLGRLGTPQEVAWWIVQLTVAPQASWVTGAIVRVDGGRVLSPPDRPL
jgi:NAD(P)-dependent dehydrogenase (short-subunit alcohol dehydrogenase family)